jgi:hypothetical protein
VAGEREAGGVGGEHDVLIDDDHRRGDAPEQSVGD